MRLDKFIFCEGIRHEANGLVTLVGVVPGDNLQAIAERGVPIALPMFCCYAVFDYVNGLRDFELQCEVSGGAAVLQRTPIHKVTRDRPQQRSHGQGIAIAPFVVPGPGTYTFTLIVRAGGETQKFSRRLVIEGVERDPAKSVH